MPRVSVRSVFIALAVSLLASAPARTNDPPVTLIDGYIPRFAQKKEMNREYGGAYKELHKAILGRQAKGMDLPCSTQILSEAGWLIQYTNDRPRIEKRLEDARRSLSLSEAEQRAAREQSPVDGSFGGCFEEWFLRLHASADPMKELAYHGQRPTHPLKYLDPINSPARIRAHFDRLKISRVASEGRDHRKELNLTVTGLGQLLFLDQLKPLFDPAWPRDAVAEALKKFMDEEWQNDKSGYWGPWYEIDGKIAKLDDLSITFHIASYRGGKVKYLDEIVRTTLKVRERPYPYGWQDRYTQNNHHAYDVVRLLRFGWPMMTPQEKARTQAELFIISARALRLSLNAVGEFDDDAYTSIDEAYYFGVSLLDEIGYFRDSQRFWISWKPENAEELRELIAASIDKTGIKSPMMMEARRKLMARD